MTTTSQQPAKPARKSTTKSKSKANKLAIHVFGDSHSRHILPKAGTMTERIGFDPKKLAIKGEAIVASSIAGFRPQTSTLQTKEIIRAALPDAKYLMLGFGQVDLELGYYYRRVIKNDTDLTPENYVPWLMKIYLDFIDSMQFSPDRLAIKGCHLTVFSNRRFTNKYLERIIKTEKSLEGEDTTPFYERLDAEILGEDRMNAMLMTFNNLLMAEAKAGRFRYFDINEELGYVKKGTPRRLKPVFTSATFDHHLNDNIALRRIYLRKLLRTFDLRPRDYFTL